MGYEKLKTLIGKEVTAIGDCGMTKDIKIYGTLTEVEGSNAIVSVKRGSNDRQQPYSVNPTTIKEVIITKNNLDAKTLTNKEVIELLAKLSLKVDHCGFSRVLDVVEELTGNRDFEL